MPIGSVEIALPPLGDISQLSNGDLQLVADSPNVPAATIQRLTRLILTNARITDATSGITSMPDDLFNPSWGATIRGFVGAPIDANINVMQGQILKALAKDPDISNVPAPMVLISQINAVTVGVQITCYALTGELITVPSLAIRISGA